MHSHTANAPKAIPSQLPQRSAPGTPQVLRLEAKPRLRAGWLVGFSSLALLLALSLLGLGVLGWAAYLQVSARILPGVKAGELELGGLTLEAATAKLEQGWSEETPILVTSGLASQWVLPSDLGLQLDARRTAEAAYQVGRAPSLLSSLEQLFSSLSQGWQVSPQVNLDLQAARLGLERLAPLFSQSALQAHLAWQEGVLVAIPGELGYTIDIEQSLDNLRTSRETVLLSRVLPVSLAPVVPEVMDATPALQAAQRLMQTPATLQAYDAIRDESLSWEFDPETRASWLQVSYAESSLQVSYNPEQVAQSLRSINQELAPERALDVAAYSSQIAQALSQGQVAQIMVSHSPTSYTVQPGDTLLKIGWKVGMPYWKILAANPGLDPDRVLAGTQLVIPSKDELIPLPVIPGKRVVISINKQRMWVYQDGVLLGKHLISTGIDRSPTQPGVFQVQSHQRNAYASVWDLHMPYFLGIYEAWPGFMNGLHGLPTLANGQRLWADILGQPASFGCIILDLDTAAWLYDWAPDGTVVEIQP